MITVVITVCEKDHTHLPHCIQSLMNQTNRNFETIVMIDGYALSYDPVPMTMRLCEMSGTVGTTVFTVKQDTCGYAQRSHALIDHVRGSHLLWLNADNLVYPRFIETHYDNINKNPDAISVVNIHYWLKDHYWGVLPRAFLCGNLDLLNYCLPTELARKVNACGEYAKNGGEEDWFTLERAMKHAPVIYNKDQEPVAAHF